MSAQKPFVRTMTADIAPEDMGLTYSHEHLICRPPYWVQKKEDDLILDSAPDTERDVVDFMLLGGRTIVDATAIDYGRDVRAVAGIAERTGLRVIATAGFNKSFLWKAPLPEHLKPLTGPFPTYEEWIDKSTVDELAAHVAAEVNTGLEGTSFRAGQVKLGTGYNSITPLEEKTIYAVAAAHHETKAPVHCHTEAGTMALEQLEILEKEGVDARRVAFGHMDRNLDLYYYEKILSHGSYLCFDGLGKVKYAPESARTAMIIDLCKRGYSDNILISHDLARKSYYRSYGHGIGLRFILAKWMPRFIEEAFAAGLDGRELMDKFLIRNPAGCFTFHAARSEGR